MGLFKHFEVNPYDKCVTNKVINRNQFTFLWHADDIKVSQVEHLVITEVLEELEKAYWNEAPSTVSDGKIKN